MNEQLKEQGPDEPLQTKNDQPIKDVLKPDQEKRNIEKPKKRHGFRNFLIVLLIIIIILVIAAGATGVYEIPGVSAIFGMNKPKDLGVKTSPEALASLKEKIPMAIEGEMTDYSAGGEIFSGKIAVDTQITANEATSWLQRHQRPDPIFSELSIRQFEGGMEISAMLNKYIKAPVYAKVMVDYTESHTIALDVQKAKAGIFSIPDKYIDEAEEFLEDTINDLINRVPGFSIESYELHDGYSQFKGTFPETVKPSPNGWADLLNY